MCWGSVWCLVFFLCSLFRLVVLLLRFLGVGWLFGYSAALRSILLGVKRTLSMFATFVASNSAPLDTHKARCSLRLDGHGSKPRDR